MWWIAVLREPSLCCSPQLGLLAAQPPNHNVIIVLFLCSSSASATQSRAAQGVCEWGLQVSDYSPTCCSPINNIHIKSKLRDAAVLALGSCYVVMWFSHKTQNYKYLINYYHKCWQNKNHVKTKSCLGEVPQVSIRPDDLPRGSLCLNQLSG